MSPVVPGGRWLLAALEPDLDPITPHPRRVYPMPDTPTVQLEPPVRTHAEWLERRKRYLDHAFHLVGEMRTTGNDEAIGCAAAFLTMVAQDPWRKPDAPIVRAFGDEWESHVDWPAVDTSMRGQYVRALNRCREFLDREG